MHHISVIPEAFWPKLGIKQAQDGFCHAEIEYVLSIIGFLV